MAKKAKITPAVNKSKKRGSRARPTPKKLQTKSVAKTKGAKIAGKKSAHRKNSSSSEKSSAKVQPSAKAQKVLKKNVAATKEVPLVSSSSEAIADPAARYTPTDDQLARFRKISKQLQQRRHAQSKSKQKAGKGFLAKCPKTGKLYNVDLHIHSAGSVGYFSTGGLETADALVRLARAKHLDVIAITDYNNASFVDAFKASAAQAKITLIPGFEICVRVGPCDDVSLIALFPETRSGDELSLVLSELGVPESVYGRHDYKLSLPFERVLEIVEGASGVLIPTQLDKTPYRQLALPTLVNEFGMRAFDLVYPDNLEYFRERWPEGGFSFLSFSNSNALAQIGSRIARLRLSAPTFAAISELLRRVGPEKGASSEALET